jgi:hypothetical protein
MKEGLPVPAYACLSKRQDVRRNMQNVRRGPFPASRVSNPYLALETSSLPAAQARFWALRAKNHSKSYVFLGARVVKRTLFSRGALAILLACSIFLNYLAVFTFPRAKKGEIESVGPGPTKLTDAEKINLNLAESQEALALAGELPGGSVFALEEEPADEVYRWQVRFPQGIVYSFGLQEKEGIKPVVKMENQITGDFAEYRPTPQFHVGYVKPKVNKNQIEWQFSSGITARYTALEDRIKADYVVQNQSQFPPGGLEFEVRFMDQVGDPRIILPNPDGSFDLIQTNNSKEIFRFLAPTVKDSQDSKGETKIQLEKTSLGKGGLLLSVDENFLNLATYPIVIDPTLVNSGNAPLALSTAYGNTRHLVHDGNGNVIAAYLVSLTNRMLSYSNDSGASWTDSYATGTGTTSISMDIDTSNNKLFIAHETTGNQVKVERLSINYSGSDISSITFDQSATLDSSGYAHRPSLVVTKMGTDDHVVAAWAHYGQSGGTKYGAAYFMHCKLSNDCTSLDNWCGADANSGAGGCGTAATALDTPGDVDVILYEADKDSKHVALNQLAPSGSATYAKDLVIICGDDDSNDVGTAYAQWDSTDKEWGAGGGWTETASNITAADYDNADGYNLTLAQDNDGDLLVLSYHDTINSKLEVLQSPAASSAPTGSWTDMSFPAGASREVSVGVDSSSGHYSAFYRDEASSYVRFREVDGRNYGDQEGDSSTGSATGALADTMRASQFTLSAEKTFSEMVAYMEATSSCNVRLAIYSDSSGVPSVLLEQTGEVSISASAWNTFSFDRSVTLASGTYWLAAVGDAGTCNLDADSTGGTGYYASYSNGADSDYDSGDSFPVSFPSDTADSYSYSLYVEVDWGPEIILDQASSDMAYPSANEIADTTNGRIDLVYTQGSSPYEVYYHTWHFEETFSYNLGTTNPSAYTDQSIYMDEGEYDDLTADDTDYVNQTMAVAGGNDTAIYILKVQNTDRTNNPNISPTFIGRSARAPSTDNVYLQIWNRNTQSWQTPDSSWTESSANANTDFTISPNDITTNLDYYYFADDWVYFLVYQTNTDSSTHVFSADRFDLSALFVPENVWFYLILALFVPRVVRLFKKQTVVVQESKTINLP